MPPPIQPIASKEHPFVVFFQAIEGHLVRRYGTPSSHIAARIERDAKGAQTVTVDLDEVVPITATEWAKYGHEYRRAYEAGSLKISSETAWTEARAAETAKATAAAVRYEAARKLLAAADKDAGREEREPVAVPEAEIIAFLAGEDAKARAREGASADKDSAA